MDKRFKPNKTKLNKETQKLVLDHLYLIKDFFSKNNYDFDDMEQAANLGLCEAAIRFNPIKGKLFRIYAIFWIEKYVKLEYNRLNVVHLCNQHLRDAIFKYEIYKRFHPNYYDSVILDRCNIKTKAFRKHIISKFKIEIINKEYFEYE